jgi:hypothetical protein
MKGFTGPKEGRYAYMDVAVLNFVKETRDMRLFITRQATQVKATGTTGHSE